MSNMKVHVLRLEPGQEVRKSLEEYVHREAPSGVVVMTCCGSITSATLRLASKTDGSNKIETFKKHFEVLGMSGTISKGGTHLHICLSDEEGGTLGGHVMGDLVVFTTMEVALGEITDIKLSREYDSSTGFDELTVTKNQV
ncbi:bifunctional protein GlmU-like [Homarus americanus]|uniref:Bifunctional protein GlmU-like n=1 Tax=Homarus americanus TaxID=6706 RepID=A0A8J5MZ66_HOMAM|nr:bifunctional protein GlmU-like [Homarus americanus]XP_042220735.1 bifunctional protein GlmU-like [Homarus americanus]KAG7169640.1 Bifunctional protein GlmU-like [Homarus americanus]